MMDGERFNRAADRLDEAAQRLAGRLRDSGCAEATITTLLVACEGNRSKDALCAALRDYADALGEYAEALR
jgi:hypothetical protein